MRPKLVFFISFSSSSLELLGLADLSLMQQLPIQLFDNNNLCPFIRYYLIHIKHMKLNIFILLLTIFSLSHQSIYQPYYAEAYNIAVAMTLDQKIGQTLQVDFGAITNKKGTEPEEAIKYHLGSLLVGGDGTPDANGNMIEIPDMKEDKTIEIYQNSTLDKWQKLSSKFNYSIQILTNGGKKYDIRPFLGTDAVHGNQHLSGSVLFPHNIGLSCSHNAENFYNAGYWTSLSVKKTGFNYAFAPTVAVSHNPQWGRFYQTMGQEDDLIYQYAKSFTEGLQGKPGQLTGILGSAKHFYADGATIYGADEGNVNVGSFKSFIYHNTQGYNGSLKAEVGSVMCSYSSINWLPVAIGPALNTILRQKLGFDGFVISDYDEVERVKTQGLPTDLFIVNSTSESLTQIVNAGIDMLMLPGYNGLKAITDVIAGYKQAINVNKTISIERLNDAVARIISVKLALGVATLLKANDHQIRVDSTPNQVQPILHITSEYQDSLQAVRESVVLLKNAGTLPVKVTALEYIVLVGQRIININGLAKNELFRSFDNIGMQNGGWTLRWQGFEGNTQWLGENKKASNASSILDALVGLNQKFELVYPNYTTFTETIRIDLERTQYLEKLKTLRKKMNAKNTLIIGVVGQSPYAEFKGDIGVPYCVNQTILGGVGCLYDNMGHPYLPPKERASLALEYEKFDKDVISHIREEDKNIPLLTVILAGRPMIIDDILTESTAVLDAFLPGTSGGQGIIDVVTGKYILRPNGQSDKKNSLSFDWPKTQNDLKSFPIYSADGTIPRLTDPLYKVGYGLSTFTGSVL